METAASAAPVAPAASGVTNLSDASAFGGLVPPVQALSMGFSHDIAVMPASSAVAAQPAAHSVGDDSGSGAGVTMPTAASAFQPSSPQPAVAPELFAAEAAKFVQGGQQAVTLPLAGGAAEHVQSCQGVRIGDVGVMLSYKDSSELADLPDLFYLPNAPAWVKGLVNLHGNLLPVFDVAEYLGVVKEKQSSVAYDEAEREKNMLLVLGHGVDAAGIVIDGLPQRLTPSQQQQTDTDTAPALLLPHLRGAYFMDGQLWFELDCDSLLNALEQEMMPKT